MSKAIVVSLLYEHDIETSTDVLTLLGSVPISYTTGLNELQHLIQMVEQAKYTDAKTVTLIIENNVYCFGIAAAFLVRFPRTRIVVKKGGELIDLSDFTANIFPYGFHS